MVTSNAASSLAMVIIIIMTILMLTNGQDNPWSQWTHQQETRAYDETRALFGRKRANNPEYIYTDRQKSVKPNIIFVLTDDQDVALGSLDYMPRLMRIIRDAGAHFQNAFVTTPICCPSRSSILTGMYVHNHNVYTNNDNCSSLMWQLNYEQKNFGTYLTNAGYRTGYFGKYLNDYDGQHIPPGWTEWVGLIRNTRFYNYSLNVNGNRIKHYDIYKDDYLTDLIANESVSFFKQSKQYFPNRPVAMVLSMPAPHGPEDAAPQYQHLFPNVTSHRTPSWNFAPNPDKQWILQYTGKMEPIHIAFTDMLQRKRLQTLQSVDDAIEKVYKEIRDLGELDNTYWLFTSDHGYHIGQYGLIKGKSMPYDFDVRVPFLMRGPGIPRGVRVDNIALNVDIAPTLLDIAGIPVPEHMDGKSLLELFQDADKQKSVVDGVLKKKKAWRDTFLIERGKITDKKIKEREKIEAQKNLLILKKQFRLQTACEKAEYQPPCNGTQQWVCRRKADGNLRIYKCRYGRKDENEVSPQSKCRCPLVMNKGEKKRQRQFLRNHVNQPDMLKTKFIRSKRYRRLRRNLNSDLDLPPMAKPGRMRTVFLPQHSIILDGSSSTDDHGIISYKWIQSSEQPLSVDIVGTRTPKLHLSNLEVGEYRFTLTVEDTIGQTSSQSVKVIVKPGTLLAPNHQHSDKEESGSSHPALESGHLVEHDVVQLSADPVGPYQVNDPDHSTLTNRSLSGVATEEVLDGEESKESVRTETITNQSQLSRELEYMAVTDRQQLVHKDNIDELTHIRTNDYNGTSASANNTLLSNVEKDLVNHKVATHINNNGSASLNMHTGPAFNRSASIADPDKSDINLERATEERKDLDTSASTVEEAIDVNGDSRYDDYSEYYFVPPPLNGTAINSKHKDPGLADIEIGSHEVTARHGKRRNTRRRGKSKFRTRSKTLEHAGNVERSGWARKLGKLWSELLHDKLDVDDKVSCRVLPNTTVVCEEEVYNSLGAWQMEKQTLDAMIKQLKHKLETLKDVKQHLRKQRPEESMLPSSINDYSPDDSSEYDYTDNSEEADEDIDMALLLEEFAEPHPPKKEEECICEGDELISPKRRHHLASGNQWSKFTRRPIAGHRGTSRRPFQQLTPRQLKRLERQEKRDQKKRERENRRQQKQLLRLMKRDQKRREGDVELKPIDPTRDCNSKNMKCFTHSNEHWKSAPFWESNKWTSMCHQEGLDCTEMTNSHWKVAPYWTMGPFCFCPNSNNNTYWCLRTLNETHNFLYCEFITGFISYYDMTNDPYQLRNAVYDLSYPMLQEMHNLLEKLKKCKGHKECTIRYRNDHNIREPNAKSERRRRKSKQRVKANVVIGSSSHDFLQWSGRRRKN